MARTDYPELIGKDIKNITGTGEERQLKVNDCNFDIGVSLSLSDDPNNYCVCLPGPSSPDGILPWMSGKEYKTTFYTIVNMLKSGIYKVSTTGRLRKTYTDEAYGNSMAACPFGQ